MTLKNTTYKVSISDGKQRSALGYSNANVPNGTLQDVCHDQGRSINLLSIYHACQKGYRFEAWNDKYVLKDIKHNFKIIYSSLVDHNVGLYKFTSLIQETINIFNPMLVTLMNKVHYGMKC